MDVAELRLNNILGGGVQYRIPLYQRPYAWGHDQLERLWSDVVELAAERREESQATHFTGSLVLSLGAVRPGGNEFLVVDGQQRLTTLSLLLCALRDHIAADLTMPDRQMRRDRIHEQYLVNRFASGDDRLKLLPTQADRDAYRKLVDGHPVEEQSGLTRAYRFLTSKLRDHDDPDDLSDIDEFEETLLIGLTFVSITARDENVFRIFESLNNTGMKLTQGDLVRNYVFMRLGDRAEHVYETAWRPMQEGLSSEDLADLFWMDLLRSIPEARRAAVYQAQQRRMAQLSTAEVEAEVHRFASLSALLQRIRHPQPTSPIGVRLLRLAEWGNSSMEPLLLEILRQHAAGAASDGETERALAVVESYFVRRLLSGAPDSGLVRILMRTVGELADATEPIDQAVRRMLSTGRRFFASDVQLRATIPALPLYMKGKSTQRKLVLAWLEESYGHREQADLTATSIEHVLPQTLTSAWREELAADLIEGETVEQVHEESLHTLGNLTLTGYNSELSNRPFTEKREWYEESHFELTKEIGRRNEWTRATIRSRSAALAERAIELWPGPVDGLAETEAAVSWELADRVIESIPAGRWSTYGSVAAVAGSHPVPLGQHIGTAPAPNAWRVLQAAGTISGGFRWLPGSVHEGESPRAVLAQEGIEFDEHDRAAPGQKIGAEELAALNGIELDLLPTEADGDAETTFFDQLVAHQSEGVVQSVTELMNFWRTLGGTFRWGRGMQQRSCSFAQAAGTANAPLVINAHGTLEINFQHFRSYVPFNDLRLREELRAKLNSMHDVDVKPALLDQRPPIALSTAFRPGNREALQEILRWFQGELAANPLSGTRAEEIDSRL